MSFGLILNYLWIENYNRVKLMASFLNLDNLYFIFFKELNGKQNNFNMVNNKTRSKD